MGKIELLAPAGSMESLYAAVCSGTDAVYIGGSKFSARAYASNFDAEKMKSAIDYCHLYGVKVYVTINTLMKSGEIEEAFAYATELYNFGADALIIQDAGFAAELRYRLPQFEIHASTQMTVHNGESAIFLKERGFKRIVLSRELSLKEIEYISKDLNIETEIFVHGALCVSYSGQCLMSSMIGGRSGNRGRCAQPCRQRYILSDKSGYLLSPKDICTLGDIEAIIGSGTASLKIEGRMKRPEYVAGVVKEYRKAIDAVYSKESYDTEFGMKNLLKLFNREGFSKAYLFGNTGSSMMSYNLPKNTGYLIGNSDSKLNIKLQSDLSVGDGVRVGLGEEGFTVSKIIINGKETESASEGDTVILKPSSYKLGDDIYLTSSKTLMEGLRKTYLNPYERKLEIPLQVKFVPGENLELTAKYEDKKYNYQGQKVEIAINKPLSEEKLKENLCKSGDTPFKFNPVEFSEFGEGFLSVSKVNEARRELMDLISKQIINKRASSNLVEITRKAIDNKWEIPEVILVVHTYEQLKAAKTFFWDIAVDISLVDEVNPEGFFIKVPNIIREEFEDICNVIDKNIAKIKGLITANAGIINRFKQKTCIVGDYKLNIMNSKALDFYEDSLSGSAISVELNKNEIIDVLKETKYSLQVLIYGRIEIMVSEYCAVGSVLGGRSENKNCSGVCKNGKFLLKDKMGEEFLLISDKYCRSHIYNSKPLNLIPFKKDIKSYGAKLRLDFVDEGFEEVMEVLRSFKEGKWAKDFSCYTRGHFKRGVE